MLTLQEMREARAKAISDAKALRDKAKAENRELTAEELAEVERLLDDADKLAKDIEAKERAAKLESRLDSADRTVQSPRQGVPPASQGVEIPDDARVTARPNYNRRELQAFCSAPGQVSELDEADAYHVGMMLVALLGDPDSAACRSAHRWCRERDMNIMAEPATVEFDPEHPESWGDIGGRLRAAAQTSQTNAYGGAVSPTVLSNRVIDLATQYGAVRREMAAGGGLFPVGAETTQIPRRTGGLTAYFVGDQAAATESRTAWDNVNVSPKELCTLARVPMSLMEDSIINWADRVVVETARSFAQKEDQCAIDGDGTSTYGGMTGIRTKMVDGNHAGSYEDATAGDDQWGEYIIGDFLTVVGATKRYPGTRLKWWISPVGNWGTFQRLAYAGGGVSGAEFINGVTTTKFVGYPVVESEAMPSASTAYNELVVTFFGDISQACTFADRRKVMVRRSEQRYFEYRQIGILGTERFDFVVHDIGDGTNAGPLHGLRGNTS